MRILLFSNASYEPPKGGSTRSNLVWLRHLAAQGHACRVVCSPADEAGLCERDGIAIERVANLALNPRAVGEEIQAFRPDWVLVSSEDLSHMLLREASRSAPDRIVYLAHTPQWYPFGPESWNPDPAAAELVRKAAGVVAIGRHMAGYIREHAGWEAAVIHPPIYGAPERMGARGGKVLMINPCRVKGIEIFLGLADGFPDVAFAGLVGWGTTPEDRAAMVRRRNIAVMESVPRIDDALREARLLLMPSIWYEGFGLIAMEAMLRGLPVIASDSGGLKEAKQGTGFVITVRPFPGYSKTFDAAHMPVPIAVEQDLGKWAEALETLLNDEAYEAESARSLEVATRFTQGLRASDFEAYLKGLRQKEADPPTRPAGLSDAKRALLLKRLKERH